MSLVSCSIEGSGRARSESAETQGAMKLAPDLESSKAFLQYSVPSDTQLLDRVAQGDRDAFAALYDRFSKPLYSFAVRILNDRSEAEDVLQESFLAIWKKARFFNPIAGKPFSWAVTITRNKSIDYLRARHRCRFLAPAVDAISMAEYRCEMPSSENHPDGHAEQIYAALSELPCDQRQSIELAFFRGLTHIEIAAALQEPLGTIKTRIRRGMMRLRDALEE